MRLWGNVAAPRATHDDRKELGKAAKRCFALAFSHLHHISHCQACSGGGGNLDQTFALVLGHATG